MKNKYILIVCVLFLITLKIFPQAPQLFNYQAVVRGPNGNILPDRLISVRISILESTALGTAVYVETHQTATNTYGLINLKIGTGTIDNGTFTDIAWHSNTYFLKLEIDINAGTNYIFMGTTQLLSVPYALFAQEAESVRNQQTITKVDSIVTLSHNGGSFIDSDNQTLILQGTELHISGGNSVTIGGTVDLDWDPTNELQDLNLSNDTLHISMGNYAVLTPLRDTLWQLDSNNISYNFGNVGIGTNNPQHKLDINGALGLNSYILQRANNSIELTSMVLNSDDNPIYSEYLSNTLTSTYKDFNILNPDTTKSAYYRFFRETNTTGDKYVRFCRGNNTPEASALIGVDGYNSYFQVHGGNVGIGTYTPESTLHVKGTLTLEGSSLSTIYNSTLPSREILILKAGSSSSSGASINLYGATDPSFPYAISIWRGGDLTMFINNSGHIGIGTNAPESILHVNGTLTLQGASKSTIRNIEDAGREFLRISARTNSSDGTEIYMYGNSDPSHPGAISVWSGGSRRMYLDINGNLSLGSILPSYQLHLSQNSAAKPTTNTWTVASDKRLKKDITPYISGIENIKKINPVWFTYTGEANMPQESGVGVIAQELQEIAPYMVNTWTYKDEEGRETEYLGVDNGAMTYMLINAVKELSAKIEILEKEIEILKKE